MKNSRLSFNYLLLIGLLIQFSTINAQVHPSFGPEKTVTINGLTFDAMEPFISTDGYPL